MSAIHTVDPSRVPPGPAAAPPRVWLLLGRKAGDNTQLLALAGALGEPCRHVALRYRGTELLSNLLLGPNLLGLAAGCGAALAPPWPDLVIGAGRRNEPVARWIRQRHPATRLVHVGRPWARPDRFDLVITTRQYTVPHGPGVLTLDLPLHAIARSAAAPVAGGAGPWTALPRPWTVVLVGGDSSAIVLTPRRAQALAGAVDAVVRARGGSALVTTSARTRSAAADALAAALQVPHWLHRVDRADPATNPYRHWLASGDAFIVTAESMSMLAEAAATGRPLQMVDIDGPLDGRPWWRERERWAPRPLASRLVRAITPRRLARDMAAIPAELVRRGAAAWIDDPPPGPRHDTFGTTDLATAAARVRALLAEPRPGRERR